MDGGGVGRVAPGGRGGGGSGQDETILNRTMLRFRPIAPKPVTGGLASENKSLMHLSCQRTKRKYVRVRRNSTRRIRRSCEEFEKQDGTENSVVTQKVVPENTHLGEVSVAGDSGCERADLDPTAEKIEIQENVDAGKTQDRTARVIDSWVTVESVIDTCMEGELGRTDAEKVKNLESDTCPAFISDGSNRVQWVNEAYKKMVSRKEEVDEQKPSPEFEVWLEIKDEAVFSHLAFTCKVRLQYRTQNGRCTKMVPCDVWKMDWSGFAWRLDVKAALSLGL